MAKIVVIGDVHGSTKTYQKYVRRLPDGQRSLQIGDMGLGFKGVGLHDMGPNHKFFRGNHDAPDKCRSHANYLGDYGFLPEDNIFYLAGAFSIDRAWRIEGQSWWADEELSYDELGKAIDLYRQVKPRFVISHEAPAKSGNVLLADLQGPYFAAKGGCVNSRTAQALESMLSFHQPEELVFGHYHVDKQFYVPGWSTKFTCVGGMMRSGEQPHIYVLETGSANNNW
jgi:hypothetical protein